MPCMPRHLECPLGSEPARLGISWSGALVWCRALPTLLLVDLVCIWNLWLTHTHAFYNALYWGPDEILLAKPSPSVFLCCCFSKTLCAPLGGHVRPGPCVAWMRGVAPKMVRPSSTANMAYLANATTALTKVVAKTCHTTGLEASEGEERQLVHRNSIRKRLVRQNTVRKVVCFCVCVRARVSVRVLTTGTHMHTHIRGVNGFTHIYYKR